MLPATERAGDPLITLKGGHVIRTSVAIWLIDVSFRLRFAIVGDQLDVSPRSAISRADDAFIRAHKSELIAAVAYVDKMCEAPL